MGSRSFHKHSYLLFIIQLCFLLLFIIFVRYEPAADARYHPISTNETKHEAKTHHLEPGEPYGHSKTYPMFQDVHVMIFIGFGFLMTFLKKYGFGAVGLNFLVASLAIEWAILVNGFFHLHDGVILVSLDSLLSADFVAACVLITFGALIGTTTPTQLIVLTMIEVPVFAVNEVIGRRYLNAVDMGDSMFVHVFGAYFGLAVSLMMQRADVGTPKEGSCYHSDLFAMIGTVFLWLYWPSFNGAAAPGDDQHRAIINTYLSLIACCLVAFAVSSWVDPEKKFDMVHIQNSTLAGGVAIGTSADFMIQPWGAILVGCIAGVLSVLGYTYMTPFMNSKLRIHDTCGVHNLHGMPGVMAGIVGAVMAAFAQESSYGVSLYEIFPARTPKANSTELLHVLKYFPDMKEGGLGRTAGSQAAHQLLALVLTLGISVVAGIITGLILNVKALKKLRTEDLYEDDKYWKLEQDEEADLHGSARSDQVIPMTSHSQDGKDLP